MVPDWADVEALFDQALELPGEKRLAWVRASDAPPAVKREVEELLVAHQRSGFLDRPLQLDNALDPARILGGALEGKYRIDAELGQGGMSLVFQAYEYKHGRKVVLKVLRPEIEIGDDLAGRFQREVHILAQLAHPHIVGFIDSGEAAGMLYYVMPFIEGETLRHRLERDRTVPPDQSRVFLQDILHGLAHAHQRGIVHRDLKPENILLASGHAYLLDFGIAKVLKQHPSVDGVTAEWAVIGTPAYMAPEQMIPGQPLDHRADLYAVGVIAREMLTGIGPRSGPPSGKDLLATQASSALPPPVEQLLGQCTAEDPANRPASAGEVLEALNRLDFAARAPGWSRVRARVAGLAVLIMAAAVAAYLLLRAPAPEVPVPQPVAVAGFDNLTGDSTLDLYGRMAGDWLTQGLQETGLVTVVPWPTALGATEQYRVRGGEDGMVGFLRNETGAGTVVTGRYYLVGDSLLFQMAPVNAVTGEPLPAPRPLAVPRDSASEAIRELRARLMGTVGLLSNSAINAETHLARQPPRYDAYQLFDRALRRYRSQDYDGSIPDLEAAYALDTTFVPMLLYLVSANWNAGNFDRLDSLIRALKPRSAELSPYQQRRLEFYEAALEGDGARALTAARASAQVAPASQGQYNLALTALEAGRTDEALEALRRVNPDRSDMRGWGPYWTQFTHALHMAGQHEEELRAAREHRARHPDRRVAWVLEARALATLNRLDELDSLIDVSATLPSATYWSQGAAMVTAGEELLAHGYKEEGRRYLARGVNWLRAELGVSPGERGHRYWLASALYDLARWPESAELFRGLSDESPARLDYAWLAAISALRAGADSAEVAHWLEEPPPRARGEYLFARARIAMIQGDREAALSLVANALQFGVDGLSWVHASAVRDLEMLGEFRSRLPDGVLSRPER